MIDLGGGNKTVTDSRDAKLEVEFAGGKGSGGKGLMTSDPKPWMDWWR